VTLPQERWSDLAEGNWDGNPVQGFARATKDGNCGASSNAQLNLLFAKDVRGGVQQWPSAAYGGAPSKPGGILSVDGGAPPPFWRCF
jgi:hypothetical protein